MSDHKYTVYRTVASESTKNHLVSIIASRMLYDGIVDDCDQRRQIVRHCAPAYGDPT